MATKATHRAKGTRATGRAIKTPHKTTTGKYTVKGPNVPGQLDDDEQAELDSLIDDYCGGL